MVISSFLFAQRQRLKVFVKLHSIMKYPTVGVSVRSLFKNNSLKQAIFGLKLTISWHRKKMFPEKQINHKLSSQPQLFTLTVLLSFL